MKVVLDSSNAISGHLRFNSDRLNSPKSRKSQSKGLMSGVFHSDILINSIPLIKLVAYSNQEPKQQRGFLSKVNYQRQGVYRIMTKEDKMKLGFKRGKPTLALSQAKEPTRDQGDATHIQSPIFQYCCERAPGNYKEESPFTNDTVKGILAQRSQSAIRGHGLNK